MVDLAKDLAKAREETKRIIRRENTKLRQEDQKLKEEANKLKEEDHKIKEQAEKLKVLSLAIAPV